MLARSVLTRARCPPARSRVRRRESGRRPRRTRRRAPRRADSASPLAIELLQAERPDTVQHAVAQLALGRGIHQDQRAVDQPAQHVDHRGARQPQRRQHGLGGPERSAAGEAGQRPEPALVIGEQQVVAPADRRAEGALPGGPAAGGIAQQGEPIVDPARDLRHREHLDPGRRQLDRQRQSVERLAEGLDRGAGALIMVVAGSLLSGPSCEQGDRVGEAERGERVHDLPVEAERHLAGGEDPQRRRRAEQGQRASSATGAARCSQLSKISKASAPLSRSSTTGRVPAVRPSASPMADQADGGVVGVLQPDQPAAARELDAAGHLDRQPGLADAGGPDHRDQPSRRELGRDPAEVG